MAIYRQPRSPFWWLRLPRPGQRPLRETTKIPHDPATATERKRNRELAEAAYHARMGDLARARYQLPPAEDAAEPSAESLATWLLWYQTHVTATHRGAAREREILARWTRDLGSVPLASVTRQVVQEWITRRTAEKTGAKRKKHPIAASTINREITVLKGALAAAVAHGKLETSPLDRMPRLHETPPARTVLSREDEARLLGAIRRPDDRALLLMGLDTLCRLGDCLDLQRRDDQGTHLWIRDPKAGGGYAVPVTTRLRAALDGIPGRSRYYFSHRRQDTASKSAYAVRQMLERACARCDPPIPYGRHQGGITWHWATRRTAATRMLQAGIDLATVQRAGHWARPTMVLGIYAATDDRRVQEAVEGIGAGVVPVVADEADRPGAGRQRSRAGQNRGIRKQRKAKSGLKRA